MSPRAPPSLPVPVRAGQSDSEPIPAIILDDVSLTYEGRTGVPVRALDRISLRIADCEFVAVLGPTGCGKSTLLRLIADLLQPTEGAILVRGRPSREARRRAEFGFVFQEPALMPWRSALKNITLPLESVKYEGSHRDRARELLELMGLAGFGERYPHELSGGMRQRVAIARALAWNPSILLMDEPFSALDELTRERMQDDLLRIWELTRKTIVFVTHNITEATYLADRVVVLSGRPGHVAGAVEVNLSRPRTEGTRETVEFLDQVRASRTLLTAEALGGDGAG